MSSRVINHEALSQIVFVQRYSVPRAQSAVALFNSLPHVRHCAEAMVEAMATAYLVAVLESVCIGEMQSHLDRACETVVGVAIECRHSAPIPSGAELSISGWVERIEGHELTFRVQATDELEPVAEASIRVAIVERDRIDRRIARKGAAIARRELYANA